MMLIPTLQVETDITDSCILPFHYLSLWNFRFSVLRYFSTPQFPHSSQGGTLETGIWNLLLLPTTFSCWRASLESGIWNLIMCPLTFLWPHPNPASGNWKLEFASLETEARHPATLETGNWNVDLIRSRSSRSFGFVFGFGSYEMANPRESNLFELGPTRSRRRTLETWKFGIWNLLAI